MPCGQPARIERRHLVARRAVDDHRVRQVVGVHVVLEARPGRTGCPPPSCVPPAVEADRLVGQQHLASTSSAAHAQIEAEVAQQPRAPARRSARAARCRPRPGRPGRSRSCAATDRTARAPTAARACVCRSSMTTEMLRSDEPCAMARTLTPAPAERAEHVGGDAGRAGHAVADDRQDAVAASARRRPGSGRRAARAAKARRTVCGRALGVASRAPRSRSNARSCPARSG